MRNDSHGGGGHGTSGDPISADLLAQMGYETRDIALNTLSRWLVFLFIFIGAMSAAGGVAYKVFVPNYVEQERVAPLAHVRKMPPFPQLQADPRRDMIEYRRAEDSVINGYTVGGQNGQRTNLPIAAAMDILANQKGIGGIRGDQAKAPSNSYPGSGDYGTGGQPRSDNGGTGDMTNTSATNGLTDGAQGAGGTGENRTSVPGNDRTGVSAPVSGLNTQPGEPINGATDTPPQNGSSSGATIAPAPAPVKPEGGSGGLPGG